MEVVIIKLISIPAYYSAFCCKTFYGKVTFKNRLEKSFSDWTSFICGGEVTWVFLWFVSYIPIQIHHICFNGLHMYSSEKITLYFTINWPVAITPDNILYSILHWHVAKDSIISFGTKGFVCFLHLEFLGNTARI